jgi:histone-lysine N-methyltransferase SETMAR
MASNQDPESDFSKEEQRTVVRFLWLQGKTGPQIHNELKGVLGERAMSLRSVYEWVSHFKSGRTNVLDAPRSGRPSLLDNELVARAGEFLRENRNSTLECFAEKLEISEGTAHKIIHEHLNMRKLQTQWVPHYLTGDQLQKRVELCQLNLERYQREGDNFFKRIVAGDETWVASFEPELKQQTSLWRGTSFGTGQVQLPQKVKPRHAFKVMHVVFFDHEGLLLDHAVPRGTSVTATYYRDILREKLRPAIRKKRPNLLRNGVILLHDNARPHTAQVVTELLASYNWEALPHPAYSPDLSPCDFFLFGKLKSKLRGQEFQTEDAINQATKEALVELAKGGYHAGIFGLQKRWEQCIRDGGRYQE